MSFRRETIQVTTTSQVPWPPEAFHVRFAVDPEHLAARGIKPLVPRIPPKARGVQANVVLAGSQGERDIRTCHDKCCLSIL